VVNIEIHLDAESFAVSNRSYRGWGLVELTRLVPGPMNCFFVLTVPLLPALEIGVHEHHVHETLMRIRCRFNDRRICLYGRKS
jgi:hypothetical protein